MEISTTQTIHFPVPDPQVLVRLHRGRILGIRNTPLKKNARLTDRPLSPRSETPPLSPKNELRRD